MSYRTVDQRWRKLGESGHWLISTVKHRHLENKTLNRIGIVFGILGELVVTDTCICIFNVHSHCKSWCIAVLLPHLFEADFFKGRMRISSIRYFRPLSAWTAWGQSLKRATRFWRVSYRVLVWSSAASWTGSRSKEK